MNADRCKTGTYIRADEVGVMRREFSAYLCSLVCVYG
jgi:hypothetical protein